MEFEDLLNRVGSYGRFQKTTLILFLLPLCAFAPWWFGTNLFSVSAPRHWCRVRQLENLTIEQQLPLITPQKEDGTFESCVRYDIDYDQLIAADYILSAVTNSSSKPNTISCDDGWLFDHKDYDANAVTHVSLTSSIFRF